MRIKTILISVVIVLGYHDLFGQNLNKCKVDFFLLASQESFSTDDNAREYVLIADNLPNYEIKNKQTKTLQEINTELSEKLKDNKDYNKNNLEVRDSLIKYYSELAHNIGVNVIWWGKSRPATKDEIKDYKKKNRSIKRRQFISSLISSLKQESNENKSPAIIDEDTQIRKGILYQRKQRRIRDDLPIFWIQPKDSSLVFQYDRDNREYIFPIGATPIFDFDRYTNSGFVLRNEKQSNYSSMWKMLVFIVDGKDKLTMYNFKFNQGYYQPTKDYSIDIFYDKKKLAKIDEFLTSLKSENLVIQSDREEFINPTISDISFNLKTLSITFTDDGKSLTKKFEGYSDPNYRYDSGWKDRRAKQIYNFPIYYTDCYNKKLEGFNSLTLRNDYFNEPKLKKQLYDALISSPEWLNFSIEKIIFTNKSQWVIVSNKYTGVKKSRFMLADVYVKSTKSDKCYLQKEVFFSQKLDPFGEYIYSIFVSVPQTMEPYPCNLN